MALESFEALYLKFAERISIKLHMQISQRALHGSFLDLLSSADLKELENKMQKVLPGLCPRLPALHLQGIALLRLCPEEHLAAHPGAAGGGQEPGGDHRRVHRPVRHVRLPGRSDQLAGPDGALPGGHRGGGEGAGQEGGGPGGRGEEEEGGGGVKMCMVQVQGRSAKRIPLCGLRHSSLSIFGTTACVRSAMPDAPTRWFASFQRALRAPPDCPGRDRIRLSEDVHRLSRMSARAH